MRLIGKLFKIRIVCRISFDNFASSFWSLNLKMADDDSLPWGTLQCAGKLAGHRLLDWSFYALILVFPVIWYFLFGSRFKSQLGSLVSSVKGLLRGLVPISRKKKRCSHRRGVHIANVVPRPRPRTGFGGGDIEHCLLLWWYAVGADQAFQEVKIFGI
jgi:hypothetical protein